MLFAHYITVLAWRRMEMEKCERTVKKNNTSHRAHSICHTTNEMKITKNNKLYNVLVD